jgi:hypothetical protein
MMTYDDDATEELSKHGDGYDNGGINGSEDLRRCLAYKACACLYCRVKSDMDFLQVDISLRHSVDIQIDYIELFSPIPFVWTLFPLTDSLNMRINIRMKINEDTDRRRVPGGRNGRARIAPRGEPMVRLSRSNNAREGGERKGCDEGDGSEGAHSD